jgi:hypothetical protein
LYNESNRFTLHPQAVLFHAGTLCLLYGIVLFSYTQ